MNEPKRIAVRDWRWDLRVAAAFLTRLPIRLPEGYRPSDLGGAARMFPVVGLGIGLAAGLIFAAGLHYGLGPLLAAIAAVAAQVAITGALHEDGLGDLADGFGGGATPEKKHENMRDSRIGTSALVTVVLMLDGRIAALEQLDDTFEALGALLAAGAASRAAMVWLMHSLEPVRPDGLGAGAGRPELNNVFIAAAIAAAVALLALEPRLAIAALVGSAIGAFFVATIAKRQIGGQTGDVLGASQQAAELCCLIAVVLASAWG